MIVDVFFVYLVEESYNIRIEKQGWLKGWHLSKDGKQVSKSEGILGEAISDTSSSKEYHETQCG